MSLAFRSKRPLARHLRQLSPSPPAIPGTENILCIVFVPDLSTKSPKSTLDSSWATASNIIGVDIQPLVLGFEYGLGANSESVWNALSLEANSLIECLLQEADVLLVPSTRIVFVSHGLGGLIVKQALIEVYESYAPLLHQRIRNCHFGTLLLSTPHPTYSRRGEWHKLDLILRVTPLKLSRLQRSQAELQATIVANISRRFQESVVNSPVFSIYEEAITKVRSGFLDSEKFVLVDKELATTSVPDEVLLGANSDHLGILSFCVQDIQMLNSIREFFQRIQDINWRPPTSSVAPSNEQAVNDELSESDWISVEGLPVAAEDQLPCDGHFQNTSGQYELEISALARFAPVERCLTVPYHMLNPATQNADFFGRRDILAQIDEILNPSARNSDGAWDSGARTFAIYGLGGVGKTEVAREYALSRRDSFDAVFWIEADEDTQLADGFAEIATQLGYMDNPDQDRTSSRNAVLEWLRNPRARVEEDPSSGGSVRMRSREANWLLVFNNANDLTFLESFWPSTQKGSILVTSRDPMAKRGRHGCRLEPFGPDTAALLLLRLTATSKSPENNEASLALAKRLGGLPLAITQISALIDRWEMTLQEFLAYFDHETSIATVAKAKPMILPDVTHYKHSLLTVWALECLIPEALATLRVLSFMSPDSIRESLLLTPVRSPEAFTLDHYPSNETSFINARSDLTKVSLVRRYRDEGKIVLHRLVQDVVRSQMSIDAVHSALAFSAQMVLLAWPSSFLRFDHDTATWDKSEELLPHILKLRHHFENQLPTMKSVTAKLNFTKLFLFAGWYLYERSDFDSAKPLYLVVLKLSNDASLGMDEMRADVLFALSVLSQQINEAKETTYLYAQQHLELRLRLRDESRFAEDRVAMAYGELAHVQLLLGDYEKTIESATTAIVLTETSPAYLSGDDWPTFSYAYQAFALAALNRFGEALTLIKKSVQYWMTHSHENHPFQYVDKLGIVYRCLAFVQRRQDLLEEQIETCVLALKYFTTAMGHKSHYVSEMCSHLGVCHGKRKEYETASLYFEQAIRSYRAQKHYTAELALALFRKSQVQKAAGDVQGAESSLLEAQALYHKADPRHSSSILESVEQLEYLVPISSR